MMRFLLLVSIALLTTGCSTHDDSKAKKTKPAKVEKQPVETEIGRITLTPQAEQRLGIVLEKITEENVQRRRTLGGDLLIPAGKSVAVAAPFSGTVLPPQDSALPVPGNRIALGSAVLTLAPILTPERDVPTPAEQAQMANAKATLIAAITVARGDADRANAEVEAAKIALARAKQLFADRAGAERAVDDAQAQLNVGESMQKAASDRERQLSKLVAELDVPPSERTASPLAITSPQSGVLRSLSITPGQAVNVGAMLFEVVDTDKMWIRVPVYVDLLSDIDTEQTAQVVSLSQPSGSETSRSGASPGQVDSAIIEASPVSAPPSADALSSSVDLYYEVENTKGTMRPGQRVGVQLALRGETRGLTAPKKSIIYDIYGGTWVYIRTGEHAFERQRVLVSYMLGDRVVLAESPAAGTEVVTDGAAELFGTEFGAGK